MSRQFQLAMHTETSTGVGFRALSHHGVKVRRRAGDEGAGAPSALALDGVTTAVGPSPPGTRRFDIPSPSDLVQGKERTVRARIANALTGTASAAANIAARA